MFTAPTEVCYTGGNQLDQADTATAHPPNYLVLLHAPIQLKDSSAAEAAATPTMMGTSDRMTGSGVGWPRISCGAGSRRQTGRV